MLRISRMRRIASGPFQHGSATSRDLVVNYLGKPMRPEALILNSARCARRRQGRGAIRRIRVILLHPFPPSSMGLVLSRLASTTKGCSDASGWGGSAGSLPKHPNVPPQRAGIFCATASGSSYVPRSLNKERRDRKPPSEVSMPSGQIREHRRNRF